MRVLQLSSFDRRSMFIFPKPNIDALQFQLQLTKRRTIMGKWCIGIQYFMNVGLNSIYDLIVRSPTNDVVIEKHSK